MQTSTKVWLFLVLFSITFLFVGYHFGGRPGLLLSFLIALLFHLMIFVFGENPLFKGLKKQEVKGQDPWGLGVMMDSLCLHLNLRRPKVYVVDLPTATAFTFGSPFRQSCLCLSHPLLSKLSKPEIEAILAHQICHIHRQDNFAFGVSSSLANSLLGGAQWLDRFAGRLSPVKTFLSPLAWLIIRVTVSQKNYLENDDLAASLLHDRRVLAEAFWKLENYAISHPLILPPCTSHLFVVNPKGRREKNWFYLIHPKIDLRLKRLVGYFPI